MILSLHHLYYLVGFLLALTALMTLTDRTNPKRYASALFWALYAAVFLVGDILPVTVTGAIAVTMAVIAGFGGVGGGKHRAAPRRGVYGQRQAPRQQAVHSGTGDPVDYHGRHVIG